jgi:hypothetical protein
MKATRGIRKYMAAIAVVALLALTGVSLAAAQGSEPKIPFTIAGNVIWADFWYDEMGGTRVPQLISIYHLKEGTFTEKKDGYQGGILLAETVTDADGNYSITLEADRMHLAQVTIRVDGLPTQIVTEILAGWHEGIPWEMDIRWPTDWRPENGDKDHAILRRAAQRAAVQPTALAQATEPKIPFTIAGNVIWQYFWYDEMGGVQVPQLVSIYHLKEGTFTEKKDGYQGGILLAETVTDADGNYSITLEADRMHLAQVTIRVDGFPTQKATKILADWHEGKPWKMDIYWPGDWRSEDGNNDFDILKRAAQRAAAPPTAPVQAIAEPADGTPGDPAEPQATAAGTVDEAFTSPQRVYLTASQGTLRPGNRGLMELAATNPAVNRRNLEVELTLEVPAGLQVSTLDGSYDPQTGRARYVILPAESKTVMLWVEAESPGQFAVAGRAEYGPEGGGQPRGAVELSHTFVVTEPPQTTEVAEAPQQEEAPEDAQSEPEAASEEQGTAAPEAPQEEPGNGSGGGCSIGSSDSTDLSAVMFGGAMLTGLGMMLVRRRKG